MDTNFTITTKLVNVPLYLLIGLAITFYGFCLFAKFNMFSNKRLSISLSATITIVTCELVHFSRNLSINKPLVLYLKTTYEYFLVQLLLGLIGYYFVAFHVNLKVLSIISSISLFLYGALGYLIHMAEVYEIESYYDLDLQNYLYFYLAIIFAGSYGIVWSFLNPDKENQDASIPQSKIHKISFTWVIEDFLLCDVLNKEGYIDSQPLGSSKNTKFTVRAYPDNDGQVSFFLKFDSDVCKTLIVRWECTIMKYGYKWEIYKNKNMKIETTSGSLVGWKDFAKRSEIIDDGIIRKGSIVVQFEICYDESSVLKSDVPPTSNSETKENENKEESSAKPSEGK